jgi:hypothetical protein
VHEEYNKTDYHQQHGDDDNGPWRRILDLTHEADAASEAFSAIKAFKCLVIINGFRAMGADILGHALEGPYDT